jgi:hypothetical protein
MKLLKALYQKTSRMELRLSLLNSYNGMRDSDPIGLFSWLAAQLTGTPLQAADPTTFYSADPAGSTDSPHFAG